MSKRLYEFLEQHMSKETRLGLQQAQISLLFNNNLATMTGPNVEHAVLFARSVLESVSELEFAVSEPEWTSWMTMLPTSELALEMLFLTVNLHDVAPVVDDSGLKHSILLVGFREAVGHAATHLDTLRKNFLELPW